jgi:hypothetical protein
MANGRITPKTAGLGMRTLRIAKGILEHSDLNFEQKKASEMHGELKYIAPSRLRYSRASAGQTICTDPLLCNITHGEDRILEAVMVSRCATTSGLGVWLEVVQELPNLCWSKILKHRRELP